MTVAKITSDSQSLSQQRMSPFDIKFGLVILFVLSIFLLSTDDTLKIASMNASSIVSILMIVVFIFNSLAKGRLALKSHPIQKPLYLFLLWAMISLLIAKIDTSKAIPIEAYFYQWTKGLNSPDWRGLSFLLRLFLAIFTIEFIITNVNTTKKFFRVVNITILFYSIVCFYGLMQIILFGLFNIKIGKITITPGLEDYFRIGGYVGEPQTFGLILVSGYFLLLAVIKNQYKEVRFSRQFLKVVFAIATINLIFTRSVSMIAAVLFGLAFAFIKYFRKKEIIIGLIICLIICGTLVISFYEAFNVTIFRKLRGEPFTINERTITWLIGYEIIKDNPLTGIGIGQAPLVNSAYIPDAVSSGYENILFFDVFRQPPMNTYIEWTAETGLIGGMLLLFLFYKTYKLKSNEHNNFSKFVKISYGTTLIALAIFANSSSGNFYTGLFGLTFAVYIRGMTIKNV